MPQPTMTVVALTELCWLLLRWRGSVDVKVC